MSDIHRLPLVGHDMPEYWVDMRPAPRTCRARVFSRRLTTGYLNWFWTDSCDELCVLHGPFLCPDDACNDVERIREREQASAPGAAHPA